MPGCAPGAGWLAWGLEGDDSEVPVVIQSFLQDAAEAGTTPAITSLWGPRPSPPRPPTPSLLSSAWSIRVLVRFGVSALKQNMCRPVLGCSGTEPADGEGRGPLLRCRLHRTASPSQGTCPMNRHHGDPACPLGCWLCEGGGGLGWVLAAQHGVEDTGVRARSGTYHLPL